MRCHRKVRYMSSVAHAALCERERERETPNLKAGKAVSVFWPPFPLYARAFFPCSTALFLKNSHRAGPVLQEFGLILRAGVWHFTSVVQAPPWG